MAKKNVYQVIFLDSPGDELPEGDVVADRVFALGLDGVQQVGQGKVGGRGQPAGAKTTRRQVDGRKTFQT